MFDFDRRWMLNLDEIQREMNRYLQYICEKKPHTVVFSRRGWEPTVDVYETDDSVVVMVDLAGVSQEHMDLVVTRNSLTLRGERRDSAQRTGRKYIRLEIPFGPFERTIPLPTAVDPDDTTASYQAGFLEVVMAKLSARDPRRVKVHEA